MEKTTPAALIDCRIRHLENESRGITARLDELRRLRDAFASPSGPQPDDVDPFATGRPCQAAELAPAPSPAEPPPPTAPAPKPPSAKLSSRERRAALEALRDRAVLFLTRNGPAPPKEIAAAVGLPADRAAMLISGWLFERQKNGSWDLSGKGRERAAELARAAAEDGAGKAPTPATGRSAPPSGSDELAAERKRIALYLTTRPGPTRGAVIAEATELDPIRVGELVAHPWFRATEPATYTLSDAGRASMAEFRTGLG